MSVKVKCDVDVQEGYDKLGKEPLKVKSDTDYSGKVWLEFNGERICVLISDLRKALDCVEGKTVTNPYYQPYYQPYIWTTNCSDVFKGVTNPTDSTIEIISNDGHTTK